MTQEQIDAVVATVARYDSAGLSEALLDGDTERVCRILAGLEAEGEGIQLVLWQIAEDTHALLGIAQATRDGQSIQTALRGARVWGKRLSAIVPSRTFQVPGEVQNLGPGTWDKGLRLRRLFGSA